jgi:ketosteroid isomerase-like protein
MSDAELEPIKSAYDAFSRGDLGGLEGFIDPTLEIADRILPEGSPAERGTDALIANAAHVREVLDDAKWDPRQVIYHDDRVLIRVHVSSRGKHTSLPVEEDIGHVYTLRDGKAVKLDIYRTWSEALEAAGLRE